MFLKSDSENSNSKSRTAFWVVGFLSFLSSILLIVTIRAADVAFMDAGLELFLFALLFLLVFCVITAFYELLKRKAREVLPKRE